MKHYVLGFLFDPFEKYVKLILKERPVWQKGFYNGIGGHIEDGETPVEAMVREFHEEVAGYVINSELRVIFTCRGGTVFVFRLYTDDEISFDAVTAKTNESIRHFSVNNLPLNKMSNLAWLVPFLLENL